MARKNLTTSIDNDLQKEIKKRAIDQERPFNNAIEKALRDVLRKYGEKPKDGTNDHPSIFPARRKA
jgi:hypothetical protein